MAANGPVTHITGIFAATPRLGGADADARAVSSELCLRPTNAAKSIYVSARGTWSVRRPPAGCYLIWGPRQAATVGLKTADGNFSNLLAFSGASWQNTGCGCEPLQHPDGCRPQGIVEVR